MILRRHFSVENDDDVERYRVRYHLIAEKLFNRLDFDGVFGNNSRVLEMQGEQITESKKRSLNMVAANELAWKFKSKQDFIVYLD